MPEALVQVETKPAAPAVPAENARPDTTVVVTSDTMQEYTEARNSGGEFKPADAPAPESQAKAEEQAAVEPPVQTDNAVHEDGIWKPKEGKPLSKRQIEANERFAKVTADRNAANARAEAALREAAELRAKYEPPAAVPQDEPDPTKYDDAKKYAEDYSNWKDGQRRTAEAAAAAQREAQTVQERFNKDRDTFKATVNDWDTRVGERQGPDWNMHGEVISAILESDFPAKIIYDLTKEDVARINAMPTMRARLREITRMEQKIAKGGESAAPAGKTESKPVIEESEISAAPEPVTPITAKHSLPSNKVDKDGNFIGTQEEYEKFRREGKIGNTKYH